MNNSRLSQQKLSGNVMDMRLTTEDDVMADDEESFHNTFEEKIGDTKEVNFNDAHTHHGMTLKLISCVINVRTDMICPVKSY